MPNTTFVTGTLVTSGYLNAIQNDTLSYEIYQIGNTIYASSRTQGGGADFSGTDPAVVIQSALNAIQNTSNTLPGGVVGVRANVTAPLTATNPTNQAGKTAHLVLGSHTALIAERGAILKKAATSTIPMIGHYHYNTNLSGGIFPSDVDMLVEGFTLDHNSRGGATGGIIKLSGQNQDSNNNNRPAPYYFTSRNNLYYDMVAGVITHDQALSGINFNTRSLGDTFKCITTPTGDMIGGGSCANMRVEDFSFFNDTGQQASMFAVDNDSNVIITDGYVEDATIAVGGYVINQAPYTDANYKTYLSQSGCKISHVNFWLRDAANEFGIIISQGDFNIGATDVTIDDVSMNCVRTPTNPVTGIAIGFSTGTIAQPIDNIRVVNSTFINLARGIQVGRSNGNYQNVTLKKNFFKNYGAGTTDGIRVDNNTASANLFIEDNDFDSSITNPINLVVALPAGSYMRNNRNALKDYNYQDINFLPKTDIASNLGGATSRINILYAIGINPGSGSLVFYGTNNFVPNLDVTNNLGFVGARWNQLFCPTLRSDGSNLTLRPDTTVLPDTDTAKDLGATATRWRSIYSSGLFSIGLVTTATLAYTVGANDYVILATPGIGNAQTITLPAANALRGRVVTVVKADGTTGTVSVARAGADTIEGATSVNLAAVQYNKVTLVSDGTSVWYRVGTGNQ